MSSGPPSDAETVIRETVTESLPTPEPPPPRVRGQRWLEVLDRQFARLDGWFERWLPAGANPLTQTGRAANLALIVAVASGVLMLFWYQPSVQFAYPSLEGIRGRTLGGWVRAVHRYSSDLTMLLLAIHALRVFVARKFTGPRRLTWVSGVVLLALVWFIGWTGYWLVWDQPAQQIALGSMRFLDVLPIFGEPMSRQFVADRLVPSLLFFVVFFLHMLLPLAVAAGLVVHLSRLNRVRLLPDRRLSLALVAGLALAALAVPAPLDDPARMAEKPEHFLSFKAFGAFEEAAALDPDEEAKKPVHMRGRSTAKPRRQPVTLRVSVDGESFERQFTAKGVSRDGPAIGEWRLDLAPGPREVRIDLDRGEDAEPLKWTGTIDARDRRLHVITYTPNDGFRLE